MFFDDFPLPPFFVGFVCFGVDRCCRGSSASASMGWSLNHLHHIFHPSAFSSSPVFTALGRYFTTFIGVSVSLVSSFSSGFLLLLGGVKCNSICVVSGEFDLDLLFSLVSESSVSDVCESLTLCLFFDGYLPAGGDDICGNCGLGHVLCHSGGDIGPYKCMSVVLHSSPAFFVYSIKMSII